MIFITAGIIWSANDDVTVNSTSHSTIFYHVINAMVPFHITIHVRSCTIFSWRWHQMETFSALLAICAGNSPVPGEFPAQRPVTRNFEVFFDLHPNKRLSKQWWGWWFEMLSHPLWRHRNGMWIEFCDDLGQYMSDMICSMPIQMRCNACPFAKSINQFIQYPYICIPFSANRNDTPSWLRNVKSESMENGNIQCARQPKN